MYRQSNMRSALDESGLAIGVVDNRVILLVCLLHWGLSSAGRAPDLHSGGQRFDPARLHQFAPQIGCLLLSALQAEVAPCALNARPPQSASWEWHKH